MMKKVKAITAAEAIKKMHEYKELLMKYEEVFVKKNQLIKELRAERANHQKELGDKNKELKRLRKRVRERDIRVMYYLEGE